MKVAIVGFGVENQAAYRHFAKQHAVITICDQNEKVEVPEGVASQLGDSYLNDLNRFDLIIRTVGMHPRVILEKNPDVADKITTAINVFFETCPIPIIGVTGTKGKGTTSTLIHKMLEAAGKKSVLAGNIGIPALDVLNDLYDKDFAVLELSSFQLHDVTYSPHIAVCLMVVPEHLNWHDDFEDYKRAKANMFRFQKSDDIAIYNALNKSSREIAAVSPSENKVAYAVSPPDTEEHPNDSAAYVDGDSIFYKGERICSIGEVKLRGRHNLENVCAAIAATWDLIDGDTGAIKSVVTTFAGLPFRLELVRELNGVQFFNDSFSTTPETAIAAIKSFEQPIVLIVGGSDKGVSFEELAGTIAHSNVKHVLAIGQMGATIAELVRSNGFMAITQDGLESMQKIVGKAHELTDPGDVVLLSTGCASFDMFKDYKDRGNQFNQAVQALSSAVR